MKTSTSLVLTGGLTALGTWSKDQKLSMRFFVGLGVYAAIMTVMEEANVKLAEQLAVLVLVTAVIFYGPTIVKKLGLTS